MRLVTWNMGYGFEFRATHEQSWEALLSLKPDIALVQEALPGDRVASDRIAAWSPVYPTRDWGSGIIVAPGISSNPVDITGTRWLTRLAGQTVLSQVTVGHTPLLIASIHAAARPVLPELVAGSDLAGIKLDLNPDTWPLDLIFYDLKQLTTGKRFVVGGDLNAALLFDKIHGPQGNEEFFDRAKSVGWVDARIKFHDEEQQTFFRKGTGPYQLDHIFVDELTADLLTRFEVLASPEFLALSDHAPVLVELEP